MFSVGSSRQQTLVEQRWQGALSEYVTAIAWSPKGQVLAASSAAGEVSIYANKTFEVRSLQSPKGQSIDCLAFSCDGEFLAAGGQSGQLWVWQLMATPALIATFDQAPVWIEHLAWSPTGHQLAFSLGKEVQVWDADRQEIEATLSFDLSSVLSLTWHPSGESLSVGGYQGVKVWMAADWHDEPLTVAIPSASVAIAWSPDGTYIASGNLDRTIAVLEWDNPAPWIMRGFPGKIRQLAWSDRSAKNGASLFASASAESIVIWEKHADEAIGWNGRVLGTHDGVVQAISFQPSTLLLASAATDGWVVLWQKALDLTQALQGAPEGFSTLAWHPQGTYLAAGGCQGEMLVWSSVSRGKGFGQ
ncbi:WD40 repeat domain-containing protein [Myxacorys almedinensis]|uniref:Anaphase-promoting complex subunit 4-like WD40 domain-containing protein n=1 Tax=Myxacorys almedinensis A TaxID=2690445 RepID=A0A8J7Z8D7_9CYAN|nr:PD40 domain-containing protein [Myxacorys almedinensis]NDJ19811.1 hypothetical protein [Myxacorys almedinensis A]